jgi:hypothetical protein
MAEKQDIVAQRLEEIVQGITLMVKVHRHLLDGDYPARNWSEEKIFAEFNGSALTDDPVYKNKKHLGIYLRGRWDGEYHLAQNILGNLERYANLDLSDEALELYRNRVEGFWSGIMNKDLEMLVTELGADSVDGAMQKIKELKSAKEEGESDAEV